MRYNGEKCPICEKLFAADDDVVVCPVCGTPHHRGCYLNNKDCAKSHLHNSGYLFESDVSAQQVPQAGETVTKDEHILVFCPKCGKENSSEEPLCTSCGARLYFNNQRAAPSVSIPNASNGQYITPNGYINPTDMIGDNTVADMVEFVQISANKYISKMTKLEKEDKKVSWNWAAFLFSPYWFFCRKMHTLGFLLMVILLTVTGVCTNANVLNQSKAVSEKLYEFYQGNISREELAQETYKFQAMPENIIISVTSLAIHIYAGLFGNYHYKNKAKKDVSYIRKNAKSNEQYRFALFRKGGISGIMCALSYLGFFCANQILLTALSKLLL